VSWALSTILRISSVLEAVVDIFGRLAAWTCVALVLLVAGNVLVRYFFHTGTIWLQELEWHLISPIALLGMSYSLLRGDQVRVDFLFENLPGPVRAGIEIFTGFLLIIFSVAIIKLSIPFVYQAYRVGEGSPNPGGLGYRFILKSFIPLGFGLLAIQAACHMLRHSIILYSGRS
jgi:TRAP-type mannitol/chloroaromatic compound transport system permease small subunit